MPLRADKQRFAKVETGDPQIYHQSTH